MRSVNRRDIFPALGTVLLGSIATASLAKPERLSAAPAKPEGHKSDAHLIALCEQFIAVQDKIDAAHASADTFEEEQRAEPIFTSLYKSENTLFQQIIKTPAVSIAGVRAKTKAMASWEREGLADDPDEFWNVRAYNSILRDLLAV